MSAIGQKRTSQSDAEIRWKMTLRRSISVLSFCGLAIVATPLHSAEGTLTYCADAVPETGSCTEPRVIRIPSAYKTSKKNSVEVAYPGMQPWGSVSWLDRTKFQKVEITLRRALPLDASKSLEVYFLGSKKPTRLPDIHGLEQYLKEGWGTTQLLVHRANPSLFIRCAYSGLSKDEARYGCSAFSAAVNGVNAEYSYKRALLPHALTIQSEVERLVRSFSACGGVEC
jgi:hypothetical protein